MDPEEGYERCCEGLGERIALDLRFYRSASPEELGCLLGGEA